MFRPLAADAAFVAHAREDVPFLLALVDDLQRVLGDLREESDAAREAMRYRRALEEVISHGCIATATTGGVDYTYRADLIAREALAGPDAGPVVNLLGRHLPRG